MPGSDYTTFLNVNATVRWTTVLYRRARAFCLTQLVPVMYCLPHAANTGRFEQRCRYFAF